MPEAVTATGAGSSRFDLIRAQMERSHPTPRTILRVARPNVIIIILESFTAKIIEPLGGMRGITPALNSLVREGILFDQFYASGDRTDKGLLAILSAYPAQPRTSIIRFPHKTQNLPFLSRVMRAQGGGSIVNISSTYGHDGAAGASVYSASKHAVEGLTKSAALEAAGSGVRVNAVAPGPTETAMLNRFTGTAERKAGLVSTVPLQRMGQPDEIANAIVFLASDKASFTTGQVLWVDGGKSAG